MDVASSPLPVRADDLEVDAALQRRLAAYNRERLRPRLPADLDGVAPEDLDSMTSGIEEDAVMRVLERRFVTAERARIAAAAATAPSDPDGFVRWFEELREHGPGQQDPLFPWLAELATRDEMRWFLAQEVAGEAGFEDLLALTQLKLPNDQAKLEMARNFWDEMGRGHAVGMHGPMLARLARTLDAHANDDELVPEALALGNLMIALAANREYTYHSVGALGVIELTAPGRAACVNAGLARLGLGPHERQYYALHATLDRQHSAAWDREVLPSLVRGDPRTARAMAEGALLRLRAGARCFERYRRELGLAR